MDFVNIDMFMSLAGCVLIIGLVTQALKQSFKKVSPLIINFIVSVIIGAVRVIVIGDYSFNGIITGVLNIFVLMLAAGGGYDTAKLTYNTFKGGKEIENEEEEE